MDNQTIDIQAITEQVLDDVTPFVGKGKVADYIPALANVPINQFGIAVQLINGETAFAGDAQTPFSIQSISKVFTLTLALQSRSEQLWLRVGKEPSGDPFNSLLQLEHECGIPRNPLINAGALVIADTLVSDYESPLDKLITIVRSLAGKSINYDIEVAASEIACSHRNASMAHLMKSFGNLQNPVNDVINAYCHQCSLAMNCCEVAAAFNYLADGGARLESHITDMNGRCVIDAARARRISSLMLTCGTYDRAGEFAFEVGLPAKSGVGGGIVAIVPGRGTIAVWSPGLGESGNSITGVEALKRFVQLTGWSIF